MNFPTAELRAWFQKERRPLPWRTNPTPYRVWVSEVMLQQTQAAVVTPYFERWMEQFPTIAALAAAPIDDVLKCWEGLGYYSRARNLHKAACHIVSTHNGELPLTLDGIPGIGPYTRGAIASFAFHKRAAAVDGNVLRVLARFFALEDPIDLPKTRAAIEAHTLALLPDERPWEVMEGLIELGALVCKKTASCTACPLRRECLAYRHGRTDTLPTRRPRPKAIELVRTVGVIVSGTHVLLTRGGKGKVMEDLYEFPYVEGEGSLSEQLGLELEPIAPLPEQRHFFTRYRARLRPHLYHAAQVGDGWHPLERLSCLPFSSGHKRILDHFLEHHAKAYSTH